MAILYDSPVNPVFNTQGLPAGAAKVYFYYTGTTTLAPVYTDAALSVPLANPVIANAFGFLPNVYLDPSITYRIRGTDFAGASIGLDIDPYLTSGFASVATRTALTGLTNPILGQPVFLNEPGRQGWFVTTAGNMPTTDPQQGIYVPSSTPGYYYTRVWDGTIGVVEWFGAVPGGADAYTGIMAAYNFCRAIRFKYASYYTSQTIVWDQAFKKILTGGGDYNGAEGQATRLLLMGRTGTTLQIGPTTIPAGGINSFPQGIEIDPIWVARTQAPDIDSNCTSINHSYTLRAKLRGVTGAESINCWRIAGVVAPQHDQCRGFRSVAGYSASGTADKWVGVDLDASMVLPSAAGGNASVYIVVPNVTFGGSPPANSQSILVRGSFTDTFLIDPETNGGAVGIRVIGNGASTNPGSNTDLKIINPTCDAHTVAPLYVSDVSPGGSVEVTTPYGGPSGDTATAAAYLKNNKGCVKFTGGQFPMAGAPGCPGIRIEDSSVPIIDKTIINECSSTDGAVIVSNVQGGTIEPVVQNVNASLARAVQALTSTALKIAPTISGTVGKIGKGVELDATTARSKIECTGINSALLSGGAAAKLIVAGTAVIAKGTIAAGAGNNEADGVMV